MSSRHPIPVSESVSLPPAAPELSTKAAALFLLSRRLLKRHGGGRTRGGGPVASKLGASKGRVWRDVVLPLLRPALLAGWALTFVACMRDLVASVMLLPPGAQTAGSYIFTQFEQGDMARAMAMAVCATGAGAVVLLGVARGK